MNQEANSSDNLGAPKARRYPQKSAKAWFQQLGLGAVCLLLILILIVITLPSMGTPPEAVRRSKTVTKLHEIQRALFEYEMTTQQLPPAYVTDSAGKPLFSWRVLILPYLGQQALYDKFDLTQAWDSPTNLPLVAQMPHSFQSPYAQTDRTEGMTTYQALVDVSRSRTAMKPSTGGNLIRIKDGTSQTALLMENRESPVIWTAPKDTDPAEFLANFPREDDFTPVHVAFCNGSISVIQGDVHEVFEGAMYANDGKVPPR
ncbi:DUF1559 domain-containing protein [Blastopirellula marina]|uniref:DUF1559 domain-containing protein n=1 Tax=Blastopirellula marina TaxID=124 RepID=A0A2S8FHX4_9BACT|nr:DUF1559 domain-containing protein [Blastopirellula marina]PQO31753.1 hypothetical protein C5Y98_20285 [Blastopirellula marina]PTL43060.1 DUF1559 domain-containing protein [Blastopirellula marina]